jgi:replication factor C subunit 2/4
MGPDTSITSDDIYEIAGHVSTDVIQSLLELWHTPNLPLDQIIAQFDQIMAEGYPVNQLLLQFYDAFLQDPQLTSIQKSKIALLFGQVDQSLVHGSQEYLQVLDLLVAGYKVITTPVTSVLLDYQ